MSLSIFLILPIHLSPDRVGGDEDGEPDLVGGEEDHVEGLQFLAERDMRSLHRVGHTH